MVSVWDDANLLPEDWDEMTHDNWLLQRDMLILLQRLNPCNQKYHMESGGFIMVTYQFRLDLFTFFGNRGLKKTVTIAGIPLSVAQQGYAWADAFGKESFQNYIESLQGLWVILNSRDELRMVQGLTLPSCQLAVKWDTFAEYVSSMRSHYRRRINQASAVFSSVEARTIAPDKEFTPEMHALYRHVYQHSDAKLEMLSIDYFRHFPAVITVFYEHDIPVGFVQIKGVEQRLVFLFCGMDYTRNKELDIYMNMLLYIVQYAIEHRYQIIELGQTTEASKMTLGATQHARWMYLHHHSPWVRKLGEKLMPLLSYKPYTVRHRVFKEAADEGPSN